MLYTPFDRGQYGLGSDPRSSGICQVALHDHRTASSQRRGDIATSNRKREWEIGCAKNRDRPDGALHHAKLGEWHQLSQWQRLVTPTIQIRPLTSVGSKQAQLRLSSAPLPHQACSGQTRFL